MVNLFRTVEIPAHVHIKTVLHLRIWDEVIDSRCRDPMAIVVEFANPRHSTRFLASADIIERVNRYEVTVESADILKCKINAAMQRRRARNYCSAAPYRKTEDPKKE